MRSLLSFTGQIRPLPYALSSAAIFFSQHLLVVIAYGLYRAPLRPDWLFYAMPPRFAAMGVPPSELMLIAAFGYGLIVAFALAALAFRRAANADIGGWIAAAAIVPVIQIPVIVLLCLCPALPDGEPPTCGR